MALASRNAFTGAARRGSGAPQRFSRSQRLACVAKAGQRMQLPIFPLNVVALPSATVPLMIFEARYRVLFNTILAGGKGVEEGLVQTDSPFCGSRRFGMCYVQPRSRDGKSTMEAVGTVLEVLEHAHVQDGRILVTCRGRERFRIVQIIREQPIVIAEVEELAEDPDEGDEVTSLAREVADLLRSTIRLNVKLNNLDVSEDALEPQELSELGPRELSFWIATFFQDIKALQQSLLEESSTLKRLTREKEILSDTVRYYSATVALKSLETPSSVDATAEGEPKSSSASPPSPSPSSSTTSTSPAPAPPSDGAGDEPAKEA